MLDLINFTHFVLNISDFVGNMFQTIRNREKKRLDRFFLSNTNGAVTHGCLQHHGWKHSKVLRNIFKKSLVLYYSSFVNNF